MDQSLEELLEALEADWDFEDPATADELAAAEQALGGPLPEPLTQFYRRTGGASIGKVDVFWLDEFRDVNNRRSKAEKGVVFFASDGADGFFLLDVPGRMEHGKGAVFWVNRGAREPKHWVFTAPDFISFLTLAATGDTPWAAPSLGDVDLEAMIAALEAHRDRWTGNPGAIGSATFDAGPRLGVRVPNELEVLLEISNGFRIQGSGITVLDLDHVEPVPGATADGMPGALWFAADDQGNRYAVTVTGWRESAGGDVVRVAGDESPDRAPIVGSLPATVVAWLGGKQV
jgi:hypothetical protein